MASQAIDFEAHCESFRGYLTALSGARVGPELRGKLDPADLVRQALLEACRARSDFRGEGAAQLRAWLRSIMANVIADGQRQFGGIRGRERSLEAMLDESSMRLEGVLRDGGSSPSHKVARKEQVALPADALGRLPEDQRRAVELRHLRGDPLERIADEMGRSVPAVAGLLRRGLRALRSELEAAG